MMPYTQPDSGMMMSGGPPVAQAGTLLPDPMTMMMMLGGLQDPLALAASSKGMAPQPLSPMAAALLGQATQYGDAAMEPSQLNALMQMIGMIGQQPQQGMMGMAPAAGGGY